MSGSHRSNYGTELQLQDDGLARIDCPLKGVMAIARCREFQRDTAAAGKSCRCSVYATYRGGEANARLDPALNEELCGRELTDAIDEELAEHRRGKGEIRRREDLPAVAKSLDAEIATLQGRNRRPLRVVVDNEEEGKEMANHPRQASRCGECGKPSPEGTKVFGGLCKPCRDKRESKTIDNIVEKHVPKPIVVEHTTGPATSPTVATVLDSPKARQQLMQPVVQADFDRLSREVKGLTRALNRALWLAQGVREGYIPVERLIEIEQERATLEKLRS
jgi:hypothetical protein